MLVRATIRGARHALGVRLSANNLAFPKSRVLLDLRGDHPSRATGDLTSTNVIDRVFLLLNLAAVPAENLQCCTPTEGKRGRLGYNTVDIRLADSNNHRETDQQRDGTRLYRPQPCQRRTPREKAMSLQRSFFRAVTHPGRRSSEGHWLGPFRGLGPSSFSPSAACAAHAGAISRNM